LADHVQADLWATPQSFNDPSLLPGHEKHAILSPLGVAGMEELRVGCVARHKLSGGAKPAPDAVSVDGGHVGELGILRESDQAEVNNERVTMSILRSVLAISRARDCPRSSALTTNVALLLLGIQDRYGVFATISGIKGTRIDPAVVFGR
jgi:hypothetical protein